MPWEKFEDVSSVTSLLDKLRAFHLLPPVEFRKYNIVLSLFKHNCLGKFNSAAEPIPGTVGLPAFPEPAKNTKVLFIISYL